MSRVIEEMMAVAKVQARSQGRAVVIGDVLRADPDSDAMILAPIKMAGESRLWAVAYGRRGQQPTFVFAPDCRDRDAEAALTIKPLVRALDDHFLECLARERAPQVWVSSAAVVRFLDGLSERRNSRYDTNVALLGLRLHFIADRYFYKGQQVMMAATDVLSAHFATGQSIMEDQHLGAYLAWLNPPPDGDVVEVARQAEDLPAGVSTDVGFDYDASRLLTEFSELRSRNRAEKRPALITKEIGAGLETMATRIFQQIEEAIGVLERQKLPRVTTMDGFRREDYRAFSFYMQRGFVPLRGSADDAARQLSAREAAIDRAATAFIAGDQIEKAIALQSGEVIEGSLTDFEYGARADSVHELTFETKQLISKLRVGDTMRVDSTKNIVLQLIGQDAPDRSGVRKLRFRVAGGKTFLDPLFDEEVALLPTSGGFFDRSHRPSVTPWIVDRDANAPAPRGRQRPADPVAALDSLR